MKIAHFVAYCMKLLKKGKKIVVPTNSSKAGEKLFYKIKKELPKLNVGLVTSDTDEISVSEWGQYDCFIYSPTIGAGISFNDIHFDILVSYFSNRSCNAEFCSQMLNRVRNLKDNLMYMFFNLCDLSYPTTNDELDKSIHLQYISSHLLQTKYDLNHSPVFECLKKDIWYQIYKDFIKRENMSKNNLMGVLARILIDHGMDVKYDDFFYRDKNVDLKELQNSIVKIDREVQAQEAEDISKPEDIDEAQFQKLDKKKLILNKKNNKLQNISFKKFMVYLILLLKRILIYLL